MSTKIDTTSREETVEEFLARGCRIQRIEHYPDPEGRVLFRGRVSANGNSIPVFSRPATVVARRSV